MNIFKQFFKSLYSPKDIAVFRFQGIGKTILYVFFLSLISVLPTITYFSSAIIDGLNATQNTIETDLPSFTIKDGELKSEEKAPITINQNDFTIYFDSTGTIEVDELDNTENIVGLLKNDLVLIAGGQVESYPYSMFNLTMTKDDFIGFLNSMDSLLAIIIPIVAVVIYIFSSGIKFIEISILAIFGLMLRNFAGKNLQYRQLWRMAAYSVTLPTVFFTIMEALKTAVPSGFLINWFVSIIVLTLAIKEIPRPKQK